MTTFNAGNRVVVGFWGTGELTNKEGTVVTDVELLDEGKVWARVHLDVEVAPRWIPHNVLDRVTADGAVF